MSISIIDNSKAVLGMATSVQGIPTIQQIANMNFMELSKALEKVEKHLWMVQDHMQVLATKLSLEDLELLDQYSLLNEELVHLEDLQLIFDLAGPESRNWTTVEAWEAWASAMQKTNPEALAKANIWNQWYFPAEELACQASLMHTTDEFVSEMKSITDKLSPLAFENLRCEELEQALLYRHQYLLHRQGLI